MKKDGYQNYMLKFDQICTKDANRLTENQPLWVRQAYSVEGFMLYVKIKRFVVHYTINTVTVIALDVLCFKCRVVTY